MSITLTKSELRSLLCSGGSPENSEESDICISSVAFDSRDVTENSLFICLQGANDHGHKFVKEALSKGASCCLVENSYVLDPDSGVSEQQLLRVEDTLTAFNALATWWRSQLDIPFVGITGSVGKTTVKDLAASILAALGAGFRSRFSFNNHVGVPFSVCGISKSDNWALLELGMNKPGEIRELVKIATPEICVVTKIGRAHLESFASQEEVGRAKFEIFESNRLKLGILCSEDKVSQNLLASGAVSKNITWKFFGKDEKSDLRILDTKARGLSGIYLKYSINGNTHELEAPVLGEHNAYNLACALLIAYSLYPNIEVEQVRKGLASFVPAKMRLNVHRVKDLTVVDDCYNANPDSIMAMLDLVSNSIADGNSVGLVLGEMLELGQSGRDLHSQIGGKVSQLQLSFLIAVGNGARHYIFEGNTFRSIWVPKAADALTELGKLSCDVLFVKGSRGVGLDVIVNELLKG